MKKIIKLAGILMFIFFLTGCKDHTHELIHINAKDATCMEEGTVEHWKCKTCEKCFLDELGEIKMKDITIKKLDHNFDMSNIKWEWLEDNEEAVVILTCKNGETHQERLPAVVTSKKTTEAMIYTATFIYDNVTYTNIKQDVFRLDYELSQDKTSYIVTGIGTYKDTNIDIPSEYNGLPVTSIGESAFSYCISLTSIEIPNSVTCIEDYAFTNCNSLTNITLPNSVTSIGRYAFQSCSSLTNITLPNSVTYIGDGAFSSCSLTSIILPDSVTCIEGGAFSGCRLTSITIPDSVTCIEGRAFSGCRLTSITIPDSVTSIGKYAFSYCKSLTSIEIPNSVTNIGDSAFYNCSNLTSITIPSSVTSIGEGAFFHCSGLLNIIVDENNPIYDSRDNCNAIIEKETNTLVVGCRNTMIPSNVTSIGDSAFLGCSGLTNIAIPSNVTRIETTAFGGCKGLTSIIIPNSITSIEDKTFWGCNSLTNIILGDSITHIGDYAFIGCSSLTSISLPNTITSIGIRAFYNCGNLQYNEYDNCYYLGNEENPYITLIKAKDTTITNVVIHKDTKVVSAHAFSGCSDLTDIKLPNCLINIGDYAFANCKSVTNISLPNSVMRIGRCAFVGCQNLINITLPNSMTWIGDKAFAGCNSLQYKEYENCYYLGSEENPYIMLIKAKDKSITNAVIHNNTKFIYSDAFAGCYTLESVTFNDSLISIGDYAFGNCSSLTSIIIPNSVTYISSYAFINCTNLTSVTFANTNGWSVSKDMNETTGITVDVSDATMNAENLTSTYNRYYWKRS